MGCRVVHDRQSELSLLDAVLAGNRLACQKLYQRYRGLIEMSVRKVYRRSGVTVGPDEVNDMVAEIWLFLLDNNKRSLQRFEPDRQIRLGTWLGLIARNKTIDRLRAARDKYISIGVGAALEERACGAPTPSDAIEQRERSNLAAAALQQLKPDDRRFLEAWYIDDRHPDELAHEFGIAVGTVYSRRFKIQEKLARAVTRLTRDRSRWPSGPRHRIHSDAPFSHQAIH